MNIVTVHNLKKYFLFVKYQIDLKRRLSLLLGES